MIEKNNKQVVVVVPVYKEALNEFENISLKQLYRMLGNYDIVFVAPETLQGKLGVTEKKCVEYFSDSFFVSTEAYSKLCLSEEFYKRFFVYEYMLLYQLDAFVFSDRLLEFCNFGYDYIGAPLPRGADYWHELKARVGNGGVSLRRIDSAIRILQDREYISKRISCVVPNFYKYEDLFWGYCGACVDIEFSCAPVALAKRFSMEHDIGHAFRKFPDGLPFGCHAWNKVNCDYWYSIIQQYGYKMPYKLEQYSTSRLRHHIVNVYLRKRKQRISAITNEIL